MKTLPGGWSLFSVYNHPEIPQGAAVLPVVFEFIHHVRSGYFSENIKPLFPKSTGNFDFLYVRRYQVLVFSYHKSSPVVSNNYMERKIRQGTEM
jgi:hypothetical protein